MKSFALNASKKTKSTSAGEIPVDWGCVSLEAVSEVSGGVQKGPHRAPNANPVRYLTVAHVQANKILTNDPRYFELSADELERWRLKAGDLLVVEGNGSAEQIGRTALFKGEIPECVHQNHLIRVRPNTAQVAPEFLNVFLNSEVGRKVIGACSFTSSGLRTLSVGRIKTLPIPLPSLAEQCKIAAIFSVWDEGLEKLDGLIEAKERRKKALMQRLLTGQKRLKGFDRKWCVAKLGELFTERVEQNRLALPLLSITANRGVIRRDGMVKRDTSSEDKCKYLRIAPGDIGYNTMRMWQGVSALSSLEGIVSPAYTIVVPGNRIDGRFAAHLFKHSHTIHLFHRYSQGMVDDTLNLKFPNFAVIELRIPAEIAEQRKIAEILDASELELSLHRQQRTALDRQKRGLMQRLLTGKIRV
jgi:type I restriction enzyme S subunit